MRITTQFFLLKSKLFSLPSKMQPLKRIKVLRIEFISLLKIRIGYVLKSADVRTQVSSRYSENSSHTYLCTSTHPHAQLRTPAHTRTHPCTSPHIPAHGLNLINHMKLHVNRPNTKKARQKKEKRKEQESAEAFQRTKKSIFSVVVLKHTMSKRNNLLS